MRRLIVLREDLWGAILDRATIGYVVRWFDSTAEMTRGEFQDWMLGFANEVDSCRRPGLLVDATQFGMPEVERDGSWREEHVVPRYNAAGVQRLAFLMPKGMAAVGRPARWEGGATYPTAYFDRRADAVAWLARVQVIVDRAFEPIVTA